MSNTDLEDDLRGTFERAAASVPPAEDLTGRATAGARRAQRRTWIASGAAAVAVAAVAVAGFGLAGSQNTPTKPSQVPAAGPPPSASQPVEPQSAESLSARSVAGTWRPVQMVFAFDRTASRPESPVLVLKADGTWTGSDGCNGLQGTYSIGPRGGFTATPGPQHLIGCENVPHTGVLRAAKRIALAGDTLQFLDADGKELARYARAR